MLFTPVRFFLMRIAAWLLLASSLCLAACDNSAPAPSAADEVRAESLRPTGKALAEKYERSCMMCHTKIAAQAPLTGFAAAWKPRMAQGMDTLLRHTQQGLRGMPAGGQCADCSADELRALITFMAHGQ